MNEDDTLDGLLNGLLDDAEPDERHELMYAFTHVALRDAAFQNHPELVNELRSFETHPSPLPLVHFWSKAQILVQGDDIFDGLEYTDEDPWTPFEEIGLNAFGKDGHTVYVITLPEPRTSPEAYFAAIAVEDTDLLEYMDDAATARYFTLELSADGLDPMFCEWDRKGEHLNFGSVPAQSAKTFSELVLDRLGVS